MVNHFDLYQLGFPCLDDGDDGMKNSKVALKMQPKRHMLHYIFAPFCLWIYAATDHVLMFT